MRCCRTFWTDCPVSRRRKLTPEDQKLWDLVASRAEPLSKRSLPPAPGSTPKPAAKPAPAKDPLPGFRVGEKVDHHGTHDLLPSLAEQMGRQSLRMDAKTHRHMTRGKLAPEARLDMHGMTLDRAHPELIRFILSSYDQGRRLVLVITGKGKDRDSGGPIPTRFGVLRHQVPQWLRLPPVGSVVLQVSPAAQKHGGHGAYYVYLRRRR